MFTTQLTLSAVIRYFKTDRFILILFCFELARLQQRRQGLNSQLLRLREREADQLNLTQRLNVQIRKLRRNEIREENTTS